MSVDKKKPFRAFFNLKTEPDFHPKLALTSHKHCIDSAWSEPKTIEHYVWFPVHLTSFSTQLHHYDNELQSTVQTFQPVQHYVPVKQAAYPAHFVSIRYFYKLLHLS